MALFIIERHLDSLVQDFVELFEIETMSLGSSLFLRLSDDYIDGLEFRDD